MGKQLIIKGADFSENALERYQPGPEPEYEGFWLFDLQEDSYQISHMTTPSTSDDILKIKTIYNYKSLDSVVNTYRGKHCSKIKIYSAIKHNLSFYNFDDSDNEPILLSTINCPNGLQTIGCDFNIPNNGYIGFISDTPSSIYMTKEPEYDPDNVSDVLSNLIYRGRIDLFIENLT